MINIYDLRNKLDTEKIKIKNCFVISVNKQVFNEEITHFTNIKVTYEKNQKEEKEIWKVKLINWKTEDINLLEENEMKEIDIKYLKLSFTPYITNNRINISIKSIK